MHKLEEVIFMACTEVYEGLNSLIRICRDLLTLAGFNSLDGVIDEHGEVSDAVVNVCRLVYADEGFVENSEEVAKELESRRLRVC